MSSTLLRARLLGVIMATIVTFNGVPITAQSSTLQATSVSTTAAPTTTSSVTVHTVDVAKDGNAYTPNQVFAEVGDVISFRFYPTNHTVIRAQYEYPCIPYEDTGEGLTGFFSGFHPLSVALEDPPTWNVTINSTEPIFYYCSAPNSCIGAGMVGVINPNSTQTFEVQQELAFNSTYMLLPGEAFPEEGGFSSTVTMNYATATSALASITSSAASSTASAASSSTHHDLSSGAIAGIAVGGAVVLAVIVALTYLLGRNKGIIKSIRSDPKYGGSSSPMTPAPDAYNARSPHFSNPPMSTSSYQYSPELQQQQAQQHPSPGFYDPRHMYGSQSPPPHAAPPYHQHTSWGGNEEFVRSYPGATAGTPPTSPPLGSPPMTHPAVQTSNLSSLGRQDARVAPQSPQELAGTEKAPVDATEVPTTRA